MLTLTDSAIKAVSNFITSSETPITGLRISVSGGGCSGMQYGMSLEEAAEETDTVVEFGELKVFVDPASAPMLEGVKVDFVEGLEAYLKRKVDGVVYNSRSPSEQICRMYQAQKSECVALDANNPFWAERTVYSGDLLESDGVVVRHHPRKLAALLQSILLKEYIE